MFLHSNIIIMLALSINTEATSVINKLVRKFPNGFQFGVSTSSYQIEGAWNVSGKGESCWDRYTHSHSDLIADHRNADRTVDSYHLYKEDVKALKYLGVDFYRFSLSWPRILPTGGSNNINPDGIRYYNALIDELLRNNITPLVTIYHWDLPQTLQDLGGWTNDVIIEYYQDFARLVFEHFGDRVKKWVTFNEPLQFCLKGYGKALNAPGMNLPGNAEYLCAHNVLRAHAKAYRLYQAEYKVKQSGIVGITIDSDWFEPASEDPKDVAAATRAMTFQTAWYSDPIFSKRGDYPELMRNIVDENSKRDNFTRSRLPRFTPEEVQLIKGSADFFGLNHYSTSLMSADLKSKFPRPSFDDDQNAETLQDPSWPIGNSSWLAVVPWGFGKLIDWVRTEYDNPTVIITENGFSTPPGLNDNDRIDYIQSYVQEVLDAIDRGSNVVAYTYWSLMDNFEWNAGFSERFGLFEVDHNSVELARIARKSADYYKTLIATHAVPEVENFKNLNKECLNNCRDAIFQM